MSQIPQGNESSSKYQFSGGNCLLGCQRGLHPRKLIHMEPRNDGTEEEFPDSNLGIFGVHVSFRGCTITSCDSKLSWIFSGTATAGWTAFWNSISSAGFGLASGLVGWTARIRKVRRHGGLQMAKVGLSKENLYIYWTWLTYLTQKNMLDMGIFHLNLGCEHQQTWFSPPRMLCKCHSCFLGQGVSAWILTIFGWKQLKGVNKLGAKGSTFLN